MFAYRYAGEPVEIIEDANTLIIDFGDGTLCRLKKDQVEKRSQAISRKRSQPESPESRPSPSRSTRQANLKNVVLLSERRNKR